MNEPCQSCKGQCCKVGFIVQVFPNENIYNNEEYVDQHEWPLNGGPFKTMKSDGSGYICKALNKETGECKVWPNRPQSCRDFEVDGERCLIIRKEYGRP